MTVAEPSTAAPPRTWSLMSLCREARVSRWAGRAAVEAGLLRADGWGPADVIPLRTAAALATLRPDAPPDVIDARNHSAVVLATALAADSAASPAAVVLVGRDRAASVSPGRTADLGTVLATFGPDELVMVVPVGQWIAQAGQVMPG